MTLTRQSYSEIGSQFSQEQIHELTLAPEHENSPGYSCLARGANLFCTPGPLSTRLTPRTVEPKTLDLRPEIRLRVCKLVFSSGNHDFF